MNMPGESIVKSLDMENSVHAGNDDSNFSIFQKVVTGKEITLHYSPQAQSLLRSSKLRGMTRAHARTQSIWAGQCTGSDGRKGTIDRK